MNRGTPDRSHTADDERTAGRRFGDPTQAFIIWGERAWPPDPGEAETLASALCDVFGSGYFESFLTLVQARGEPS